MNSLWGWTQGRCGRRHRVSVSAAAGTGSHAQRKQANAACAYHKPVVWPWVVCMDCCHLSTARMQINDKQCTRTMETGRARPRLVSTHDRTRMCNAVDEATTTRQQPHQRRDALLLPFARRTRQKERNLLRVTRLYRNNHSERDALSIKSIRHDTQRVASRDPLQKTITRQPIHT